MSETKVKKDASKNPMSDPSANAPAKIEQVKIEPLADADTDKVVGGFVWCSAAFCSPDTC